MGRGEPAGFLIAGTKGSRLYFLVCDAPAESAGGGEKVSSQADLAQASPGFAGAGHNKEKKVNSRFTFCTAALAAACLFSTGAAWAQRPAAAPSAAAGKVGVTKNPQGSGTQPASHVAPPAVPSPLGCRPHATQQKKQQVNDA